jgi:hypothetical protein
VTAKANALKRLDWGVKPNIIRKQFGVGAKNPTPGATPSTKYVDLK